jgi:hypothetical protein
MGFIYLKKKKKNLFSIAAIATFIKKKKNFYVSIAAASKKKKFLEFSIAAAV